MRRYAFLVLCAVCGQLSCALSTAEATLFFNDFENGVSRNTSGGIWTGYDNGFFGVPQWLETDTSHNHTPGGTKSARAYEADPWVYNSYADFGATGEALRATVYLYEDGTYVFPYTEPHEAQRASALEVRSMFTLFGDSLAGPSETDPDSDYIQIRTIPDLVRPEDPLPDTETDFYTYGIRTKYNDVNSLGIIDTGVHRKDSDWLKLVIEVDTVADGGEVRFFIDDVPVGTSQRTGADLRWVMMGATGPTYENYWYDDISVIDVNGDYGDYWQGDYNGNGATDAADYVVWRKDAANSPGAYNTWQQKFGFEGGGGGASNIVPEPAGIAVVGFFGLLALRRGRKNLVHPRLRHGESLFGEPVGCVESARHTIPFGASRGLDTPYVDILAD